MFQLLTKLLPSLPTTTLSTGANANNPATERKDFSPAPNDDAGTYQGDPFRFAKNKWDVTALGMYGLTVMNTATTHAKLFLHDTYFDIQMFDFDTNDFVHHFFDTGMTMHHGGVVLATMALTAHYLSRSARNNTNDPDPNTDGDHAILQGAVLAFQLITYWGFINFGHGGGGGGF